jgi:hypothetical protein
MIMTGMFCDTNSLHYQTRGLMRPDAMELDTISRNTIQETYSKNTNYKNVTTTCKAQPDIWDTVIKQE